MIEDQGFSGHSLHPRNPNFEEARPERTLPEYPIFEEKAKWKRCDWGTLYAL
jgi:hypothetical protein